MEWVGCGSSDTRSIIIQLKYILDTPPTFFFVFLGNLRYLILSANFVLWFTVIQGERRYLGFRRQGKLLVFLVLLCFLFCDLLHLCKPSENKGSKNLIIVSSTEQDSFYP
jgi:hypothetical protein